MYQIQNEATSGEFWFSFIFFNIIVFIEYLCARDKEFRRIAWILPLVFCIWAFWDTDYYSFKYIFQHPSPSFRDPLYYYLTFISFDSYSIYRLIIWGGALLLYYKTCSRLELNKNIAAYIFTVFFLLTFSFARASLGMALYFYGLSYLLKPDDYNKNVGYIWGTIFILLSYLGHRSLLPIIAITPFIFIPLTKQRIILILCIIPLIAWASKTFMLYFIYDGSALNGQFSEFSNAVRSYSTIQDFELNWKFKLITIIRNASHYLICIYLLWTIWFNKRTQYDPPTYIMRLITISLFISCIAAALSLADVGIASVTSKRYLYMTGIPLCLALTYLTQEDICDWRNLNLLLVASFIWGNGYFIGKIISHY